MLVLGNGWGFFIPLMTEGGNPQYIHPPQGLLQWQPPAHHLVIIKQTLGAHDDDGTLSA